MSFTRKARRLLNLEKTRGYDEAELRFEDGSMRKIKVPRSRQRRLKLLLASMDFYRHSPSGHVKELPPRKESEFDPVMQLLGNAVEIKTTEKSLILSHNMCRCAVEEEKQQKAGSIASGESTDTEAKTLPRAE